LRRYVVNVFLQVLG